MNKAKWFYRLSALAIALLCVAVVLRSCAAMQQIDVATGDIPLLRGKAALREALPGDPRLYRLMDMALTGQPVADPLTLTAQDCLYVGYEAERFEEVLNDAPDMVHTWSRTWVRHAEEDMLLVSDELSLFGDIPLVFSTCRFDIRQYTDLEGGLVHPALQGLVRGSYYYPGGTEEVLGAQRYHAALVPTDTRAALPQAARQGCRSYA